MMLNSRKFWPLLAILCLPACEGEAKKEAPAPVVQKPKSEAELAFISLAEKAVKSLEIRTQAPRIDDVQEYLALPGWIMAAPGHEVIVTAPAAGYVRMASEMGHVPAVGEAVGLDTELFRLEPVSSPAEQIQIAALKRGVESELAKAKVSLKVAHSEWERLKVLVEQKLRGQQELDLAKKTVDHAGEELAAATDKQKLFDQPALPIRAPRAGKVVMVHANPGQYVAAAAPLVTVLDLKPAWLRVPVPEFELAQVDGSAPVQVIAKHMPAAKNKTLAYPYDKDKQFVQATPVGRSPVVEPGKHSVEFHYELAPLPSLSAPAWSKDQLVTVNVPLNRRQRETVVPYSAIVLDIHGSAWIYLDRTPPKSHEHRYQRRRIEVGAALPEGIVIRPSLAREDQVVTHGSAALFSAEFHFPPGQTPQDIDDDD